MGAALSGQSIPTGSSPSSSKGGVSPFVIGGLRIPIGPRLLPLLPGRMPGFSASVLLGRRQGLCGLDPGAGSRIDGVLVEGG